MSAYIITLVIAISTAPALRSATRRKGRRSYITRVVTGISLILGAGVSAVLLDRFPSFWVHVAITVIFGVFCLVLALIAFRFGLRDEPDAQEGPQS